MTLLCKVFCICAPSPGVVYGPVSLTSTLDRIGGAVGGIVAALVYIMWEHVSLAQIGGHTGAIIVFGCLGTGIGVILAPWTAHTFLLGAPLWKAVAGPSIGAIAGNSVGLWFSGPTQGAALLFVGYCVGTLVVWLTVRLNHSYSITWTWRVAAMLTHALCLTASGVNNYFAARSEIMWYLHVKHVPKSVRHFACNADSWVDYIGVCNFIIDASDFDTLLVGRPFKAVACQGTAFILVGRRRVGEDFSVAHCFHASGRNEHRSLFVQVLVDATRQHVTVSLTTGP